MRGKEFMIVANMREPESGESFDAICLAGYEELWIARVENQV